MLPRAVLSAIAMTAIATANPAGHIVGKVLDAEGVPAEGVSVSVVKEDADGPRTWYLGSLPQPLGRTNVNGEFRLGPVEAGEYSVFVFGSKEYFDYRARPAQGVAVGDGDLEPVILKYEESVQVTIRLDRPTKLSRMQGKYWVRCPNRPLVNGMPTYQCKPEFKRPIIRLTTLPGEVELSMDPTFTKDAEVFTFQVDGQGVLTGPETIPPPMLVPIRIAPARSDGKALSALRIHLQPAWCSPPGPALSPSNFVIFKPRDDPHVVHVTRGVVARVFVSAAGCEMAESAPFTALPGLEPIPVTLSPAKLTTVTFNPTGSISEAKRRVSWQAYRWWYTSPSGYLIPWFPPNEPAGDLSRPFKLSGLPEGARILVQFWLGGPDQLTGKLEFEAEDGGRFELDVRKIR